MKDELQLVQNCINLTVNALQFINPLQLCHIRIATIAIHYIRVCHTKIGLGQKVGRADHFLTAKVDRPTNYIPLARVLIEELVLL